MKYCWQYSSPMFKTGRGTGWPGTESLFSRGNENELHRIKLRWKRLLLPDKWVRQKSILAEEQESMRQNLFNLAKNKFRWKAERNFKSLKRERFRNCFL